MARLEVHLVKNHPPTCSMPIAPLHGGEHRWEHVENMAICHTHGSLKIDGLVKSIKFSPKNDQICKPIGSSFLSQQLAVNCGPSLRILFAIRIAWKYRPEVEQCWTVLSFGSVWTCLDLAFCWEVLQILGTVFMAGHWYVMLKMCCWWFEVIWSPILTKRKTQVIFLLEVVVKVVALGAFCNYALRPQPPAVTLDTVDTLTPHFPSSTVVCREMAVKHTCEALRTSWAKGLKSIRTAVFFFRTQEFSEMIESKLINWSWLMMVDDGCLYGYMVIWLYGW